MAQFLIQVRRGGNYGGAAVTRSSDFSDRDSVADICHDAAVQLTVEAGHDWRKPYYRRVRGLDWSRIKPGEASVRWAGVAA